MSLPNHWNPEDAPDERCLASSRYFDLESETIQRTVAEVCDGLTTDREKAVSLFHFVRDEIRYDPYRIDFNPEHYLASRAIEVKYGFCVPKAVTYTALLRAAGIPAVLGFADVTNHLSSEKLLAATRSKVFAFHGYSVLWVEEKWLKATPTFNRTLCDRAGINVLEFDGRTDALMAPYDKEGRLHMEYLRDRGWRLEFDMEEMTEVYREHYPHWFETETFDAESYVSDGRSFEDDIRAEKASASS